MTGGVVCSLVDGGSEGGIERFDGLVVECALEGVLLGLGGIETGSGSSSKALGKSVKFKRRSAISNPGVWRNEIEREGRDGVHGVIETNL